VGALDKDALTIIVPTYNRAHTLPRAIDSVLRQTDGRWRLIIVDDGSMDNTPALMREYQDVRIAYDRYQPNRGASHARNRGANQAQTNYIAFLDSDDEFLPDAVEIILKTLKKDRHMHWMYLFPCIDSTTKKLIGRLPDKNHAPVTYLDVLTEKYESETVHVVRQQAFEHYNFNEDFLSYERTFWYSVYKYLGPGLFCIFPVRTYYRDTTGGSIMQFVSSKEPSAFDNSKRQSKAYLDQFGEDLLRVNRRAYFGELQKLGIAHLYLREYAAAQNGCWG